MKKLVTNLRKNQGIWVLRSGGRITHAAVEKTIRKIRKEREKRILGKRS